MGWVWPGASHPWCHIPYLEGPSWKSPEARNCHSEGMSSAAFVSALLSCYNHGCLYDTLSPCLAMPTFPNEKTVLGMAWRNLMLIRCFQGCHFQHTHPPVTLTSFPTCSPREHVAVPDTGTSPRWHVGSCKATTSVLSFQGHHQARTVLGVPGTLKMMKIGDF